MTKFQDSDATSRPPGSGRAAVLLNGVWAAYDGRKPVLRGASLRADPGSCLVLMGPSGAGKTTLLKTMNGLVPVRRGRVEVLGQVLGNGVPLRALRSRVGYIPQNLGLVLNLTVTENVLLGALPRTGWLPSLLKRFPREALEAAEEALQQVGLEERWNRRAFALSGGERQRVAVARALVQRPRLLLADEFLSELDHVRAREVADLVDGLRRRLGMTVVTIQHEIDIARRFGGRVVVVREGRNAAEMAPGDLDPELLGPLFRGDAGPPETVPHGAQPIRTAGYVITVSDRQAEISCGSYL